MSSQTGTIQFASALSTAEEAAAAVAETCGILAAVLGDGADLAIAFATGHHLGAFEAIDRALQDALGPAARILMSAQGVIGRSREIEQGPGLSVLAGRLPGAHLATFEGDPGDWPQLRGAPERLRSQVGAETSAVRALMVFADPFSTPQQEMVDALQAAFPAVPTVGGMASAGRQPGQNRLGLNGRIRADGAIGVALSGSLDARTTVSQGCRPIGRPYVITRSIRNVVQELGGRNAYQVVREMVEDLSEQERNLLATQGLLLGRVINEYKDRFGRGDFLIRNIAGIDPDLGYVAVSDPHVRVGQTVQFQARDATAAAEDLSLLLDLQKLHGPAGGAVLFSCNGRGTNMFGKPDTDATLVRDALGDIPLAGCFAMGEIGPVHDQIFIHGHTASLLVLRDGQGTDEGAAGS